MNRSLAVLLALTIASLGESLSAAPLYWDGGTSNIATNGDGISQGTNGTWNTTLQNWDQGAALAHVAWNNANNDDAYFGSPTNTVTLGAAITANALNFVSGTSGYILTDGANLANTLTVNSVSNIASVTLYANIVNASGFSLSSGNTLTIISNSPGFTGPITINSGTLRFGDNNVNNGPTAFGDVAIATNATLSLRDATSVTYGQTLSGEGSVAILNKNSGAVTTLGGANTYSGKTVVAQATLSVSSIDESGPNNIGTGPLQIGDNSSSTIFTYNFPGGDVTTSRPLIFGGNNSPIINNTSSGMLTLAGPVSYATNATTAKTINLGGNMTSVFASSIPDNVTLTTTNATSLLKQDAGTWLLMGSNSFSGGVLFKGGGSTGLLLITNDSALGAATGNLTFTTNGSTAASSGRIGSTNFPVTLAATRKIMFTGPNAGGMPTANFITTDVNSLTVASYITGGGNVNRASSSFAMGPVRFVNDTNNFAGTFSIGFGTTEFTSVANSGTPSSLGLGLTNSGIITLGNSSSAATFRYTGSGSSSTTRALNWTATTGGLTLGNDGAGTVSYLATGSLRSGSGAITLTLAGANTGANTLAQAINDSPVSGVTSLVKSGAGQWVLSGANTYTGTTTVTNEGTLRVARQVSLYNNTPASWTDANLIIRSGSTLALNVGGTGEFTAGDVQTISALGTATGGFSSGAFLGLDTSNAGGNFNYGNILANPNSGANMLGLRKLGAGALTLTAANTYTGDTLVEAGTLVLSGSGSIANSSNIVIAAGALLDVSGLSSTFTLGGGQTLSGSQATAAVNGNVNVAGGLALVYTNGTPSLTMTGGALSLSNNAVTVTVVGAALTPGTYKLVAKGAGGSVTGTTAASALFLQGAGVAGSSSLLISGGELYLVVTPLQLPYPQGAAFPLMLYSVQSDVDMQDVTGYGWNVMQRYGLANTNGDVTGLNGYLATAWSNNATASTEVPGHFDGSDHSGLTQSEVQAWIEGVTNNPNLAWWYLPEELRYSVVSERQELTNYAAWVRLYDPLKRPAFEYQANYVTATQVSQMITNVDIVAVGAYPEYSGMPHAWVRYRVQDVGVKGVTLAGRTQGSNYLAGQKTVIAVLYAATNDVNPGVIASPAEVYHDVWSAIASGAQGISVFSHFHAIHDDPALLDNLAQLNLAAAQLSGSEKIGQAVLFGTTNPGVTNVVTAGPTTTVSFTPSGLGSPIQYSSLNVLSKTWSNNVYVIAVNSTSNSVTANITNLTVASATASVPFESRLVSVSGGGFSDSFAPWGVHVYKIPAPAAPPLTPVITSISVIAGTTTLGCSNGTPGAPYLLLRSSNLANPSGWVSVATNTPSGAGLFSFTNSATGSPVFYRLRAQ